MVGGSGGRGPRTGRGSAMGEGCHPVLCSFPAGSGIAQCRWVPLCMFAAEYGCLPSCHRSRLPSVPGRRRGAPVKAERHAVHSPAQRRSGPATATRLGRAVRIYNVVRYASSVFMGSQHTLLRVFLACTLVGQGLAWIGCGARVATRPRLLGVGRAAQDKRDRWTHVHGII